MKRCRSLLLPVAVVSACLSSGCAPQYNSPQEAAANACRALGPKALSGALIGGLGGAAGGAAIGAAAGRGRGAAIGAGVGALAGVLGGLTVGNQLDRNDCAQAQIALAQAAQAPLGQSTVWESPTGSHGSYTPVGVQFAQNGQTCRQFRSTSVIAGHAPVEDTGVTCRDAAGDWHRVT